MKIIIIEHSESEPPDLAKIVEENDKDWKEFKRKRNQHRRDSMQLDTARRERKAFRP